MKTLMLLVLVAALGSSVCHKADVRKWEELPNDIAGNLKRIPDSDVLVSIAPCERRIRIRIFCKTITNG